MWRTSFGRRVEGLRDFGAMPESVWILPCYLQGLETLSLRVQRSCDNAQAPCQLAAESQ